jgi:hypothetical protein
LVAVDTAVGRRRVRRGAQSPALLRGAWHLADGDLPQPPQHRTALAEEALPACDAQAVHASALQQALARRERLKPEQTLPRVSPGSTPRRSARAGTRALRRHSQAHAPRGKRVSLSTEQNRLQALLVDRARRHHHHRQAPPRKTSAGISPLGRSPRTRAAQAAPALLSVMACSHGNATDSVRPAKVGFLWATNR